MNYQITVTRGLWLLLMTLVCACSTVHRPSAYAPCISEQQRSLSVRWGEDDAANRQSFWYKLDARGQLFRTSVRGTDTTDSYLTAIDHGIYCTAVADVSASFIKVQALHSGGTRSRYIEYANPATGVFLRAVWNPELQTPERSRPGARTTRSWWRTCFQHCASAGRCWPSSPVAEYQRRQS